LEVLIGSTMIEALLTVLLAWLVWRFITRSLRGPSRPDSGPDNLAGSPARLRPRPKIGSGAVALDEPDDEGDSDAFTPRGK
jgi:membrane protein implicated in regulation of membrane protease activity